MDFTGQRSGAVQFHRGPGNSNVPEVSIILPTYNRVDVIGRAIASILQQTHTDWELLVVDDGSTDGTHERLQGLDPRIRWLASQTNQGVAAARNTGLAAATGRYVAFMDSDDAWRPQFLALTIAFLRAHPQARWVATEFHEDPGDGGPALLHGRPDIVSVYLAFARSIGSQALDLPPGSQDDYLRVYGHCTDVGDWGREGLDALGLDHAKVYQGHTLPHMRWGYLNWLPATVLTREAVAAVGPFDTRMRHASDYRYFIALARRFTAHLIAVPLAVKYARAPGHRPLQQDHLATGHGALQFERSKLACFDESFDPHDPETARLRCHHSVEVARRALAAGHRQEAIAHLQQATGWRPMLWKAWALLALARLVPNDRLAAMLQRRVVRLADVAARLWSGRLTPGMCLDKLLARPPANIPESQ